MFRPMARVFKIKDFAKAARKAKIADKELCRVARKAEKGLFHADYGGGVIKTKLNKVLHRGMILMKSNDKSVFALLFAKKDRENITSKEEEVLKVLAGVYAAMDEERLKKALKSGEVVEIDCDAYDDEDDDEEDDEDGETGS